MLNIKLKSRKEKPHKACELAENGFSGIIPAIQEIISHNSEIMVTQNIEVNSEGQNSRDTSTGNLSEKFTSSGLDAILFSNSCTFRKVKISHSEFFAPHARELAFLRDFYLCYEICFICVVGLR